MRKLKLFLRIVQTLAGIGMFGLGVASMIKGRVPAGGIVFLGLAVWWIVDGVRSMLKFDNPIIPRKYIAIVITAGFIITAMVFTVSPYSILPSAKEDISTLSSSLLVYQDDAYTIPWDSANPRT
jgi:hypothetical protein